MGTRNDRGYLGTPVLSSNPLPTPPVVCRGCPGSLTRPRAPPPRVLGTIWFCVETNFRRSRKIIIRRGKSAKRHIPKHNTISSSSQEFSFSTQIHLATSSKPSFSSLHAQTPIFPHSDYKYRGQRIEDHLRDPHKTREPAALSSPTERNPQRDQRPSGRPPTPLGQSGCAKDNSTWNRGESLLVQRSNGGSC
jgi:hypothetical protein